MSKVTIGINTIDLPKSSNALDDYDEILSFKDFLNKIRMGLKRGNEPYHPGEFGETLNKSGGKVLVYIQKGKYANGDTYYLTSDKVNLNSKYIPSPPCIEVVRNSSDHSYDGIFNKMKEDATIEEMAQVIPFDVLAEKLSAHKGWNISTFCFYPVQNGILEIGAF